MNESQIKELYAHIDIQIGTLGKTLESIDRCQNELSTRVEGLIGNPIARTEGRIDKLESRQERLTADVVKHGGKIEILENFRWKLTGYAVGVGTASGTVAATAVKVLFG